MDKVQVIITRLNRWLFESKEYEPIETLDNYLEIEDVEVLIATIEQQQKEIEVLKEEKQNILKYVEIDTEQLQEAQKEIERLQTIEQAYQAMKKSL